MPCELTIIEISVKSGYRGDTELMILCYANKAHVVHLFTNNVL